MSIEPFFFLHGYIIMIITMVEGIITRGVTNDMAKAEKISLSLLESRCGSHDVASANAYINITSLSLKITRTTQIIIMHGYSRDFIQEDRKVL